MAMIKLKEGTTVFVPWRIQGVIRNEERMLNFQLHLLEKQTKYLVNSITREQLTATKKLEKFNDRLKNAARISHAKPKPPFTRKQRAVDAKPWRTVRRVSQQKFQSFSVHQALKRIGFTPSNCGMKRTPDLLRLKMKI